MKLSEPSLDLNPRKDANGSVSFCRFRNTSPNVVTVCLDVSVLGCVNDHQCCLENLALFKQNTQL